MIRETKPRSTGPLSPRRWGSLEVDLSADKSGSFAVSLSQSLPARFELIFFWLLRVDMGGVQVKPNGKDFTSTDAYILAQK